jgi:hypothetical protein
MFQKNSQLRLLLEGSILAPDPNRVVLVELTILWTNASHQGIYAQNRSAQTHEHIDHYQGNLYLTHSYPISTGSVCFHPFFLFHSPPSHGVPRRDLGYSFLFFRNPCLLKGFWLVPTGPFRRGRRGFAILLGITILVAISFRAIC